MRTGFLSPEHSPDQLQHGGDARPAGDHGDPLDLGLLDRPLLVLLDVEGTPAPVDQVAGGAPHVDTVADVEALQVLGHFAAFGELGMDIGRVDLDHEVHVAQVLITGGRGVRPHHEAAIDPRGQVDVLTNEKHVLQILTNERPVF